jgi:hypothetical protein
MFLIFLKIIGNYLSVVCSINQCVIVAETRCVFCEVERIE